MERTRQGDMFDRIRAAVRRIPKGKVAAYGEVAEAAGFPGAARQVVWALRQSRGLPWHRVVGSGGLIRLPGEQGWEQRMRLEAEGVTFRGKKIAIDRHQHQFDTESELISKRATTHKLLSRNDLWEGGSARAKKSTKNRHTRLR